MIIEAGSGYYFYYSCPDSNAGIKNCFIQKNEMIIQFPFSLLHFNNTPTS